MTTSQSPRKVMHAAYELARQCLPDHSCKFSRKDFTHAQLFACLVLRQFFGLSYRRTEQLLRDSPAWLADIGLAAAPDHNTLWRAFGKIFKAKLVNRVMDLLAGRFVQLRSLRLSKRPLAMDSTCFEERHRSAHYDRRCRQISEKRQARRRPARGRIDAKNPVKSGSWSQSVNASRSRKVSAMPKLSIAIASATHVILAAKVRLGWRSDAPDFVPLLRQSCRRAAVKVVVADAGYDSEPNHRAARQEMGVRSIIPAGIGRPTDKLPSGRWRRHMARRMKRKADKKHYSQRVQCETVNSMIKRNQGSALRSRTPQRRKQEMMMRVLTHNIALLCAEQEKEE